MAEGEQSQSSPGPSNTHPDRRGVLRAISAGLGVAFTAGVPGYVAGMRGGLTEGVEIGTEGRKIFLKGVQGESSGILRNEIIKDGSFHELVSGSSVVAEAKGEPPSLLLDDDTSLTMTKGSAREALLKQFREPAPQPPEQHMLSVLLGTNSGRYEDSVVYEVVLPKGEQSCAVLTSVTPHDTFYVATRGRHSVTCTMSEVLVDETESNVPPLYLIEMTGKESFAPGESVYVIVNTQHPPVKKET